MLTLTLTNTNPNPNPHRGLGRSVGETKGEVRALNNEVVQQRMQLQQLLEVQRQQFLASHPGAVATTPARPGSPVQDGPDAVPSATPLRASSATPLPALPPASPAAAIAAASSSPLLADSAASAASPTGASPASASGVSPLGPLIPHVATGLEPRPDLIELSESLGAVYANLMARGGSVPSVFKDGDRGRCKLLLQWCNATTTADEKLLLLPAKVG